MKPQFIFCLAFVLSGGLFGCSTASHRPLPNYEAELRYWRELPYPRVEKLMNVYGGDMAETKANPLLRAHFERRLVWLFDPRI